ncbi:LysR family transcriptional regulator [Shimazuella sp. AN120528]|uniref:LysR family transcriptional regulator n=1 Tax=Shimazuella soli TaxID=1892854 RepID=UPI001F0E5E5F|nr:LysR family transcriptional regulator [Shimazuella soli]MCH5586573.1 LysR family transcriptional regulator [Shimazuella soli]
MTITQLLAFVKIAEFGNFTKAGEYLKMTQPAVSHAIASLESELDTTLIIRDRKRGLVLTDIGKRVLVHAREILKSSEKIEQEVALDKGFEVGTIRVGATPTSSMYFLPKIIQKIQQSYPNLTFELKEGTIDDVRNWLSSRVVDVGFVIPPINGLDSFPIFKEKLLAIVHDHHPLQHNSAIHIQELANEPLIICKGGSELPVMDMFKQFQLKPQIKFTVNNASTSLSMVEEGLGLGILSEISYTSLPANVQSRTLEPEVWKEIHIAVPSYQTSSLAVKLFIETARKLFQAN